MLNKTDNERGVSPVIGVIIMIAITVIAGGIIGTFVLDFGDLLDDDANATLDDNQTYDFDAGAYEMEITVQDMENSDYLRVDVVGEDLNDEDVIADRAGDEPSDDDEVPDGDEIAINEGDVITVEDLEAGDEVQVFGGIDGDENLITTYEVDETQ